MSTLQQACFVVSLRLLVLSLVAFAPNTAQAISLSYMPQGEERRPDLVYSYATPSRYFDQKGWKQGSSPEKEEKAFFPFDNDFWDKNPRNDDQKKPGITCLMCSVAYFKNHFFGHKGWHQHHHCNKPDIDNVPLPPSLIAFSLGLAGLWFVSKRQKLA
ncbi:MAG: hypothetical protein EOM37_01790 [Proteobacteria bacterium]|jgi:hypothetical protein|nr:hypothetical protein [Pseudomonadota bacterium]